ncbi:MAG TPA: hypothetical protein DCM08_11035, partial [Microscillaceae bacterium]|nr:hypothetical protein [Microscillaceae bacterium]
MTTDEFDNSYELSEVLERFETMLKQNENLFFDIDEFEMIIDHYKQTELPEKVLQVCQIALAQYPFSFEVKLEQSYALAALEQYDEALNLLHQLENLQPNDADLLFLKANICYLIGNYTQSLEILQYILEFAEDRAEVLFRIGFVYQHLEDYQQALRYYFKALEANAKHEGTMDELLICLELSEYYDAGIDFFKKQIDSDPYNQQAWFHLGLIYAQKEDFGAAVQAFDYAITIDEQFDRAMLEMGHAYMNLDAYAEAQKKYKQYLQISGLDDPHVLCCLAATYEKQDDFTRAIQYYRKALQQSQDHADAWFGLGTCMIAQEKWFESVHFLKKAVRLNELQENYWLALANAEYHLGNLVNAEEAFEKANLLDPSNPDIWRGWALLYYEQGDEQKGLDL